MLKANAYKLKKYTNGIPKDWEIKTLRELGVFTKGKGITKEQLSETGLPCIRYGEIYTSHDYFIKQFYSFIPKQIAKESQPIKKNDILFAGSGETLEDIGKAVAYIGNEKAYAGGDVIIFSPNGKTDSIFLSYFLNTDFANTQKRKLGQGHSVVHIYPEKLAGLKIIFPPLTEQIRIGKILFVWNKSIELTEKLIAVKEKRKKGLMQQLLTGKKRFKEFRKEKWEEVNLCEVAKFENGKAHENSIVDSGNFIVVNSKFVSTDGQERKFSNKNLSPLVKDDIVMVMSDVPNGKALAKCFIIDQDEKYTLNQRICRIKSEKANAIFLYYILNRNPYFLQFDSGVGQTNLRKDEVLDCPVPLLAMKEQQKIASVLSTCDKEIQSLKNKQNALKQQKKGLMQVLLTGKKRVKV